MQFKQEFLDALRKGADHESLLDLVRRHQALGLTPQDAYQRLQELWLGFGFNDSDEDSALRDNLEYVMEKVWYQTPAAGR